MVASCVKRTNRWIGIETSDINIAAFTGPVTTPGVRVHVRIIGCQRHPDTIRTSIGLEKLHVCNRRLIRHPLRSTANPLIPVFILNLVDQGVLTIGHLMLAGNRGHLSEVGLPSRRVSRVIIPQSPVLTGGQPERESTGASFGIDIRSWTHDDVQS